MCIRDRIRTHAIILFWVRITEERMCAPDAPTRLYHDSLNRGNRVAARKQKRRLVQDYVLRAVVARFGGTTAYSAVVANAKKLAKQRLATLE